MPIIHAIVLGLVQGLSEFLPISSSGHLIVAPWLFGWNDFDSDSAIAAGTKRVEPGASIDLTLPSTRIDDGDGAVLRSVSAMPDGGGLDALWPVGAPGRYEVTLGYSMPAISGDIEACTGTSA